HVEEGSMMYRIADLSSVWVEFDAYESSASRLEVGDEITFTASAVPGQTYTGSVSFVDPFLNNDSRTLGIRVTADNPQNRLKPGMYAEGVIQAGTSDSEKMLVPASAILWTGTRSIVFADVSFGDTPAFEAREVTLGHRAGSDYVVESGLTPGERVVTHGTFKVDAAAQLSNKLSMMNREAGTGITQSDADAGTGTLTDSNPVSDLQEPSIIRDEISGKPLDEILPEYLKLREALSADDFETARQLVQQFTDDRFSDIEELRAGFKSISETMIARIEQEGYEGTLYKQYCPMYDGGSSWISDSDEIENPFYGSQMHNCGETVETL
ncbi:MAG: efflux RND transporter periplasmic adaptor subunit, partial [Balneolaceae bacterium]|nr:efflux RND transporter periplasmic adaptor subunit [Balneolaceae bacterium]